MASMQERAASESVSFSGSRLHLGQLLLGGYLFMVPTIGLNRFWLTTRKRRYYWSNTALDGDALEYTGDARQLLVGFLMALVVFVPVYALFFYLSMQSQELLIAGYAAVALAIWFLYGYASYRARDFRLSRTLWRGIRFDQAGNPWNYALRRFLWSVLNAATLGLVYPFMAANLWAYRYRHSWYGDRAFGFSGSWRQLLLPYYPAWLVTAGLAVAALVIASDAGIYTDPAAADPAAYASLAGLALTALVVVTLYRAVEMTRMLSAVRLGSAMLSVRVSAMRLLAQYGLFVLVLAALYLLLALGGFLVLGVVAPEAFASGKFDFALLIRSVQSSTVTLLAVLSGYLLVFGAFSFANELVLGYGFWRLIADGARVSGLHTLDDVHARAEDKALAGEGLANALNLGRY